MIPWPRVADARSPFPEPLGGENHRFRTLVEELFVDPSLEPLVERAARARGVNRPLLPHKVALPVVDELASEATLVRLATDMDPAVGNSGPDLVLGPLADEELDARTLEVAVAAAAFFPGDDVIGPPWRRWLRSHPSPPRTDRAGVHAMAMAPFAPWRVVRLRHGRATLVDSLGLSSCSCPTQPVVLRSVATPLGALREGMWLIARVARERDRWVATCPIALPGPLPRALPRWLKWLAWELRLTYRGPVTRTVLLARRGHIVARRLLEGAWCRG